MGSVRDVDNAPSRGRVGRGPAVPPGRVVRTGILSFNVVNAKRPGSGRHRAVDPVFVLQRFMAAKSILRFTGVPR
ncbi:hypothetical protein GCM10007385_29410 [Tateyamaria omphalii]|nr:hypothetical protein GCM10007385_29410 [Tateyamaria omphalii]